ncbi:acid protease [Mycena floridula]|nr:acid protease [Mycena floridula]
MNRTALYSLPFNTHVVTHGQHPEPCKNLLARDRARAQKVIAGLHEQGPYAAQEAKKRRSNPQQQPQSGGTTAPAPGCSVDVTDCGESISFYSIHFLFSSSSFIGVTYCAAVQVGSPPTTYNLLIDTGSSNTWIGAQKNNMFSPKATSTDTRKTVNVSYGSGSFSGTEYNDTVMLGKMCIPNQSIGVANTCTGFNDVDGILGIGPVDLTRGTVSDCDCVPTVTDNLFANGYMSVESIGICYTPTTSTEQVANGELNFGGIDTSKIVGEMTYVPITGCSPANKYWGIDQKVTYGDVTLCDMTAGIVDTGTTLLLLGTKAFQQYQKATGGQMDPETGLLTVTPAQYESMSSMMFNIGGRTFEFTKNGQIWPRCLNSMLGGKDDKIYLITADLGSDLGQGLDFINGFCWLQRFCTEYDTSNCRVGVANTRFTSAETN